MSFADFTSSIFSALSIVIWVPTGNPILLGGSFSAFCEILTGVSSETSPAASARNVTYVVISFVSDAGYHFWAASWSEITNPLSRSMSM